MNSMISRANRPASVGIVLVAGLAQFLVLHLVVQSRWDRAYSWAHNNVSDLGNVRCGTWGPDGRYICSPWHTTFNVAFVVMGVAVFVGALAGRRELGSTRTAAGLLAASGVGFVLAGLAPADVNENVHVLGAVLIFFCGNAGLVALAAGRGLSTGSVTRTLLGVVGAIGIVAALLFLNGTYLGLGMGGMERIPAFLPTVCLILAMASAGRTRERGRGGSRPRGPHPETTIDVPP